MVLLTYFSIVMGELVPKRIGQMAPERLACRVSPVLHMLSLAAAPFVKLLSLSTASILRLMRVDTRSQNAVTEEEIHAMIDEGEESGVIETVERDMVRNVFRLDDRQDRPRGLARGQHREDPLLEAFAASRLRRQS